MLNDPNEELLKKKCEVLVERCRSIQQDNERLVYRIHQAKKILARSKKEKKFLINRLDQHGDKWRVAPMGAFEENETSECGFKPEKSGTKPNVNCHKDEKSKKLVKKKATKNDPNAPKRPANPFFQFCQQQRPRAMERMPGEPEPTKQELTRQLATKWKALSTEDKKVYYDMYERSKEKYVAEMQIYNKKFEDLPQKISSPLI